MECFLKWVSSKKIVVWINAMIKSKHLVPNLTNNQQHCLQNNPIDRLLLEWRASRTPSQRTLVLSTNWIILWSITLDRCKRRYLIICPEPNPPYNAFRRCSSSSIKAILRSNLWLLQLDISRVFLLISHSKLSQLRNSASCFMAMKLLG